MSSVIMHPGRGRGRGLSKGWLTKFTPNPCPVNLDKTDESSGDEKYEDAEEIDAFVFEKPIIGRQTSVEKMSSAIADNILIYNNIQKEDDERGEIVTQIEDDEKGKIISRIEDDEKPVNTITFEKPVSNLDEKPANNISCEKPVPNLDKLLVDSVNAKEFVPSVQLYSDEVSAEQLIPENECFEFLTHNATSCDEEYIALHVLNDVIVTLLEDPGDFDTIKETLGEHLTNFVTQRKTLERIVDVIIEQAIAEPNFRYISSKLSHYLDSSKILELDDGSKFRDLFYKRCKEEFDKTKLLLMDPAALTSSENITKITNTAFLFGELLCNMKVKNTINVVFKKVVFTYVDKFLGSQSQELVTRLTQLLKLVGPELDNGRPKDVEEMFNKVKDFYLSKQSEFLTKNSKTALFHVYKLHSRDWDRDEAAVPGSPVLNGNVDSDLFNAPYVPEEALKRRFSRSKSVDWDEFYAGDDNEIYDNYIDGYKNEFDASEPNDEEFDAYEEFLKLSGQL